MLEAPPATIVATDYILASRLYWQLMQAHTDICLGFIASLGIFKTLIGISSNSFLSGNETEDIWLDTIDKYRLNIPQQIFEYYLVCNSLK